MSEGTIIGLQLNGFPLASHTEIANRLRQRFGAAVSESNSPDLRALDLTVAVNIAAIVTAVCEVVVASLTLKGEGQSSKPDPRTSVSALLTDLGCEGGTSAEMFVRGEVDEARLVVRDGTDEYEIRVTSGPGVTILNGRFVRHR